MLDVDYYSAHHALIADQKSSPFEINLGWTVSADKGPYNGRRALRAEDARGSAWAFVGIDVDWESLERAIRRAWTAAAAADGRVARRARRCIAIGKAGRLRDERLLVAAAQEVSRARARPGAAFRARTRRSRSRSRSSIAASAADAVVSQAAVLRSAERKRA